MLGSTGELVGTTSAHGGGNGGGEVVGTSSIMSGGDFFEGDRSTGGNRWPRQETLALLKIRSDMDAVFRDSSLKGPLWEDISRKMAELGYHRTSKKCKEKFENVYKYHKRTKDGRVGKKSEGKTYRFFDQIEALDQHHSSSWPPTPRSEPPAQEAVPVTMVMPSGTNLGSVTVTSMPPQPPHHHHHHHPMAAQCTSPIEVENGSSPSGTPSMSSSDEELIGRRKRKRKWKGLFERMMKEVIDKQEELQKRFLEEVDKRDHHRLAREEAWMAQELRRLNRQHEILVRERSMAATKDAALIEFLNKISNQNQISVPLPVRTQDQVRGAAPVITSTATATIQPQPQPQPVMRSPQLQQGSLKVHAADNGVPIATPLPAQVQPQPQQQTLVVAKTINNDVDTFKANNNGGESRLQASSSRWPKSEVEALINLRTKLDQKYEEGGPKGPLWEEISSSMKNLGYNRNAKRCKEKWENINKYFKKVKESNKKRPEDSKTCPYFDLLDALYRQRTTKMDINTINPNNNATYNNNNPLLSNAAIYGPTKPEELNTMARPDHGVVDAGSEDDTDDDGDEEDGYGQGSGGYEIVASKNSNDGVHSISTSTQV